MQTKNPTAPNPIAATTKPSPAVAPAPATLPRSSPVRDSTARHDPLWVRILLIGSALAVVGVLIVIPVISVFYQAFADGWSVYWKNLTQDPDTTHAIFLTLMVAPVAVVANVIFGVAAAWAIARFRFPGRTLLTAMIDLPFSVSPIVAGLMILLIFGRTGFLGPFLMEHDIKIAFAVPGLILATTFVTMPFVVRELLPVMEAIGSEEETAAVSLGANGWQLFWRVTVPNIKWGLLYGIILCNARAMGEFGAVYVVSGHIAGRTDTMPLRVEKLFQESNNPGSFAVASVLTLLALVTLTIKVVLERKTKRDLAEAAEMRNVGGEA
ncbi:MAG: sulfate ABC transporter permease subunit CysW [Planctomycetia bacterium]|nr:sulfate ABC transporter permease subunit CysW [Planctomycetia bacterium]